MVFISCFYWCHSSQTSLFCLCQQNKSSKSKGKSRQASNHCKRILEATKPVYVNKTKESITSQKLTSSTKVNLLYLHYSVGWKCCLVHMMKQNFLPKTFLRTLILMTQVPVFPSRTNSDFALVANRHMQLSWYSKDLVTTWFFDFCLFIFSLDSISYL